jgi:HAD superfamily hydrolase (TIGR01549 family)
MTNRRDEQSNMIAGIIFDLDGTLMDSRLDFDLIREEMSLPAGLPILEALAQLSPEETVWRNEVLHRHERLGAERAVPNLGVPEFLAEVDRRGWRKSIVTRNHRLYAEAMLAKLPTLFDPIVTRDDGPVKPDPWAVHAICEKWGVSPSQVVMIGDYSFDILCGRNAGARTVFYSAGVESPTADDHAGADYILPCFTRYAELLDWLKSR